MKFVAESVSAPSVNSNVRPPISLIYGSLLRADFTVLLRSGRSLLLNIAVPIVILVIVGLRHGSKANLLTAGGPAFVVGLALTYGLMASSLMGYSITVARDRDAGVFQRLRVTPAPTWAIMSSRLVVQIVVDLIMTVVVAIVGVFIFDKFFSVGEYLLILCVSILGGAMFLAIAQAIVGLVRSATLVNAIGRILYIVLLLLGLLGSTGILGSTMLTIANWSPVGAAINLYAGVFDLSSWDSTNTIGLIATLGYIIVGAFIGIRWFRWESR